MRRRDLYRHSVVLSDQAKEEEGETKRRERIQGRVAGIRPEDREDLPPGRSPAEPGSTGVVHGCREYPGRGLQLPRRIDGPRRRDVLALSPSGQTALETRRTCGSEPLRSYVSIPGRPFTITVRLTGRRSKGQGRRYQLPCDDIVGRMVNVASHIFGRVYFPVRSNSLKDVGKFVGATWTSENASGLQCLCWRYSWERTRVSWNWKKQILTYNEEDCVALRLVTERLSKLGEASSPGGQPRASSSPKRQRGGQEGPDFPLHDQLEEIIEFAHFGYQKSRILLRPDRRRERPTPPQHPRRRGDTRSSAASPHSRANRIIRVRRRMKCPRHDVRLTRSDEVAEKIITDLVFTKSGCKKTFVKYVGAKGYCKTCDCHYLPPAIHKICKSSLGYGFQAWVTYQRVALASLTRPSPA